MKVGDMDFPRIFRAYETAKRAAHLMDFDDMLKYAWLLLKQHPELKREFTSRYRYIHVDEAQDTSPGQWRVIAALSDHDPRIFDAVRVFVRARGPRPGRPR